MFHVLVKTRRYGATETSVRVLKDSDTPSLAEAWALAWDRALEQALDTLTTVKEHSAGYLVNPSAYSSAKYVVEEVFS